MMKKKRRRTQRERTEETKAKLLHAALQLFVRFGFEATPIEEIARKAGYTRGAFYCNFKNKEELFIAVMERVLGEWSKDFAELSQKYTDPYDRLVGLQNLYAKRTSDATYAVPGILLEYKLYAMRHPKRHPKMAEAYARIRKSRQHLLKQSMEALGLKSPVGADMLEGALAALITGLALDRAFYRHDYQPSAAELEATINLFFEKIIGYKQRTSVETRIAECAS
jgi:AcrR family transcriptional regulator